MSITPLCRVWGILALVPHLWRVECYSHTYVIHFFCFWIWYMAFLSFFLSGITNHTTSFWPKITISNLTQDSRTGHTHMHWSFAGLGCLLAWVSCGWASRCASRVGWLSAYQLGRQRKGVVEVSLSSPNRLLALACSKDSSDSQEKDWKCQGLWRPSFRS